MGLLTDLSRKNLRDSWAAEANANAKEARANAKASEAEARYSNELAKKAAAETAATNARAAREAEDAFNARLDALNFSGSKEAICDNFVPLWGMYTAAVDEYKNAHKAFKAEGDKKLCVSHLNVIKEKMEFAFMKLRSADSEQAQFYQKKYDDTEADVKKFVKKEKMKFIIAFSSIVAVLIIFMIVCMAFS